MSLFYISFATDKGFRGATVVSAADDAAALAEATRRGLNPGGEAAIIAVPPEAEDHPDMARLLNRLAGRDEMIAEGGKRLGDCSDDVQSCFDAAASRACNDCNT